MVRTSTNPCKCSLRNYDMRAYLHHSYSIMASSPKQVPIPKNGVNYRDKVVLAPMVRSGELPSRLLALKYGADLVWGPETVDMSMIGTTKRFNPTTSTIDFTRLPSNSSKIPPPVQRESVIYRLHPALEGKRLIFQLGTASPALAVKAAKLVASDVAGIDVNAGCPKPFSTTGGMGAALLQTPELLASILTALVQDVGEVYKIGISVKIRLLETSEKTKLLVQRLCQTGITGLTVHCRTTQMRPRERALRDQLRVIADVCREAGVACLMNGDVKNKDEALQLIQDYGVDGAMIATAAEANPSCFRTTNEGGLLPWREVATEYVKIALHVENKFGNTKFLLSQLLPGKLAMYKRLASCRSYGEICEIMHLPELRDLASNVDKKIGIRLHKGESLALQDANQEAQRAEAAEGLVGVDSKLSLPDRGQGLSLAVL